MAPSSSSPTGKPLMLKDFLRDDSNSESCDRFRSVPRRIASASVRYLLDLELGETCGGGGETLTRSRSRGALTKISAVIRAVRLLPFAADSDRGLLPRSFSKKLRRSFWWRQREEKDRGAAATVRVRDIVRLRSFGDEGEKQEPFDFPSPAASCTSSSGWSEIDSSGSDLLPCSSGCSEFSREGKRDDSVVAPSSPASRTVGHYCCRETKVGEMDGRVGIGCICQYEEKEQLSPVSVMDFPYEEEEEEAEEEEDSVAQATTSFHQSLANVERTKHQLLQQIKRFESLAQLVDPVDLDKHFTCLDQDELEPAETESDADGRVAETTTLEARAWGLLNQLHQGNSLSKSTAKIDALLVDFFIEGLWSAQGEKEDLEQERKLLTAANDWVNGHRTAGVLDRDGGERLIREMDRDGQWRCFEEETEEIAAVVEEVVCGTLLDELFMDVFCC